MLKKGSKLYSILTGTCPRCHGDYMYVNKNPFNLLQNLKMREHCKSCGLRYQIEPSFFFGAMYVSYGLAVGIGIAVFALVMLLGGELLESFFWIGGALFLLMPYITRWSRNIYINFFVDYDPKMGEKARENVQS